jgi:spore coat protein CotH
VLGLSGLVLDNLWQDPSMVKEAMALAMFHRVGMPASRYAFTRMAINGESQGLYALVETIDERFLARAYQDPDGYLYEYKWLYEFRFTYPGTDLGLYAPLFEPRSHRTASAEVLYGPFRDLFRIVNQSADDVWRGDVEPRLDLDQLVRYVAIEAYTSEQDGILGNWGINNHYWYRPATSGLHRVIPWDRDQAFTFVDRSIFNGVEQNEILRRALADPALRDLFLFAVEECANRATEEDWFLTELERIAALIAPAVEADTHKQFETKDFYDGVDFMRLFAATRPGFVRDEVARSR